MTNITPTLAQMAKIWTKKTWEKPIGDKYMQNSEINHIAQHVALINMGMSQLGPLGGKTGKR